MIAIVRIALLTALLAFGSTQAFADKTVKVPGTTVTVTIPERFKEFEGLTGFVDPNTGASFVVTELPSEAYPEFDRIFSSIESLNARFGQGGIRIDSIEKLSTAGGDEISLAHGIQIGAAGRSDKWAAVFGGSKTALVTMQVVDQYAFDPAVVRAVFGSVTLGQPLSESEQLSQLPFNLEVVEPFRFVGASTGSILLTVGPDDLNSENKQPVIFVVRQLGAAKSEPLETMAETQLRSTSSFNGATISQRSPVEFASNAGILLEGAGQRAGVKFDFRQYFSIADGKFIRLVAIAPLGTMNDLKPVIESIAGSIEVR